jgi:hypothetical protein
MHCYKYKIQMSLIKTITDAPKKVQQIWIPYGISYTRLKFRVYTNMPPLKKLPHANIFIVFNFKKAEYVFPFLHISCKFQQKKFD